jgi:hypothetical protein
MLELRPATSGRAAVFPVLAMLCRADFDVFFPPVRAALVLFFAVRRAILGDRRADFTECVLMASI